MDIKELTKKAEFLLKKASSLSKNKADVSAGFGKSIDINFENDNIKSIKSSSSLIFGLRLFKDGKIGISATNKSAEVDLKLAIQDAVDISEFGPEGNFDLPKTVDYKNPKTYDPSIEKVKVDDLIAKGKEVIAKIKSEEKDVIVNYLGFTVTNGEGVFLNTNGVSESEKSSAISFGVEFSRVKEGDFFQVFEEDTVRKLADFNVDGVVKNLLLKAKMGRKITKIEAGKYPVIFAPEAASEVLGFVLDGMDGKSVNEKTSKLGSSLGKKVFDKKITITDDPTIDFGLASHGLDDEGVVAYKKDLIKNGVVNQFYYDLCQAKKAGRESTGNASRGIFNHARPSLSNIMVSGGEKPYSELIKKIKKGLLVNFMIGGGQNNPYNGDFQLGINLGYLIENGEVVGRVKNTAIAGNVFELLDKNVLWLSKEQKRVGALTTPYICLSDIAVTSK